MSVSFHADAQEYLRYLVKSPGASGLPDSLSRHLGTVRFIVLGHEQIEPGRLALEV